MNIPIRNFVTLTGPAFLSYTNNTEVPYNRIDQFDLLSSREVEGNGPLKPGNPLAEPHEGCQFRRSIPRDEGKSYGARTPEM